MTRATFRFCSTWFVLGSFALRAALSSEPAAAYDPKKPANRERVVIHSEEFEGEFPPAGWRRMGNVPDNITKFSREPKSGGNVARFQGSPLADMEKWNCSIRREVSTVGYREIEVSFSMAAKLDHKTETLRAVTSDAGWAAKGESWRDMKVLKGEDAETDGELRDYKFSLPKEVEERPDFLVLFTLYAANSAEDFGVIDDVLVTGENADGKRVTLLEDDFESGLADEWIKYSNVGLPDNAAAFEGEQKHGEHSVRFLGSLESNENDFDAYFERIISTEGYDEIEISYLVGTSGFDHPHKSFSSYWMEKGFYEKPFHLLKRIKADDPENDGELHKLTFALTKEAANNKTFTVNFSLCGTNKDDDFAFLDEIVVTGRKLASEKTK